MEFYDPAPEFLPAPPEPGMPREFSEAPELINTSDDEKKEYEYASKKDDPAPPKRHRRKKSFLLQAASIMAGGMLILNSFGVDVLSIDGLFNSTWWTPGSSSGTSGVSPTPPWEYDVDPMPEKESKWPTKVHTHYHVTYLPTGETYDSPYTDEAGLRDIKFWVDSQGGYYDGMNLVKAKNTANGLQKSEDAIIVGSGDAPESIYLAGGELWWDYDRDEYYEAFMDSRNPDADPFPILPNLDPDFAGDYAWAGQGSEEYVVADGHYLWAGTYYTNGGVPIEKSYQGASYDKASNTLTLTGYRGQHIDVNVMGNGFKIRLVGENSVEYLRIWGAMYAGSVTFTGSGSIKINEGKKNPVGLMLECEDSYSCVMIDREARVEVFGEQAILIHRTLLERAIYLRGHTTVEGGIVSSGEFVTYTAYVTDDYGNTVYDQNGNPVTKEITVKDLGGEEGMELYDYSVITEDGKPSSHVIFVPFKGF